jgi:hypothetical protein
LHDCTLFSSICRKSGVWLKNIYVHADANFEPRQRALENRKRGPPGLLRGSTFGYGFSTILVANR